MTKATRRDVLKTIAAAGAGAASLSVLNAEGSLAAGAASKAASIGRAQDQNVELTWAINAQSGTEIDLVQAVVDKFVELNPNYKVEVLNYDPETYDQKLLTDISAGTLPDLFVSADVFTKPFFESNLTADLIPLAAETGYPLENFDEKFLALAKYDGKVGFLPRAADVVVTYYNKKMFDTAGIPYPTPDWTYDDMLAAAEKLTIKASDGTTTQYGVTAAYDWWAYWVPMVVAEGGQILNEDNTEAIFNSEEGKKAWGIIFTGLQNGWFAPSSVQKTMGGEWAVFGAGKAAMTFTVRALTPTFRSQLKDDWDVQVMPKGSVMRKTGMGTMGYAMSSQTKDPSATWKLLEYTYSDGLKFFMESYLIVPAISTYYDDPAWKELPGPPYNNDIFISSIDDAMLPPDLPFYSTGPFRKAMLDGIDAVQLGQMSGDEAVDNMAAEATKSLQE
jgi:multiple sugar transport system substrate-binding protein